MMAAWEKWRWMVVAPVAGLLFLPGTDASSQAQMTAAIVAALVLFLLLPVRGWLPRISLPWILIVAAAVIIVLAVAVVIVLIVAVVIVARGMVL